MAETAEQETQTTTEAAPEKATATNPTSETLQELFGDEPKDDPVEPQAEAEVPKAEEAKTEQKEQPKAKEAPQEGEDEEFSAAFQGLLTSGVPASVLKNASRSDLLKWSQKQAKREADIQRAFQDRAELQKKIDEQAKQTTAKPEPSSGMPTGAADLKALIAPISEAYGEDLGKSLETYGSKLMEMAVAAVESKHAERIGGLSMHALIAQELLLENTRARLVERFPKLSDDSEFGKVIEKTKALAATGAYNETPTIRGQAFSAMSDACGLIFGAGSNEDSEKEEKKSINRSKDAGQPKTKTTTRAPGIPRNLEERAWRAFNQAEDGNEEAARRTMAGG